VIEAAVIAEHRDAAERNRRLPPALVEALRDARAFDLLTPVEYGGLELALGEVCAVLEDLGRLDGAVAWNVWNGNMGFSAALLPDSGAARIWGTGRSPVVANSARPSATAVPDGDGFRLDGRWDIVSASEIADWIALFALGPGDAPDVRVAYVPRADVEVLDTWSTSGMRATGSHAVVATGVRVPADLIVSPFATARIDRPLYRIPAFTLASTGAAPIVVGMAQAALDALVELAGVKRTMEGGLLGERVQLQGALGAAQTGLDAARALLREAVGAIDAAAAAGEPVDVALRARLRAAMSHATTTARETLLACYQQASSSALYADAPIERLTRDGLVACQHAILGPAALELRGRVMLGLDPATPVI
jgi:alkylation response protein AidB-like acyl-CoA dehydrogenase